MKQGIALWLLVFAAPAAWLVDVGANFAFSTQACAQPWSLAPALISLVALIASGAASILLWARFHAMRAIQPPASPVYQIVAIGGSLLNAAFALFLVAESIPVILLPNCK